MHAGSALAASTQDAGGPGSAPPEGPHRFAPRLRNARAENLAVGLVTAVLTFVMLASRGVPWGERAIVALLVGIVAYGLYALRIRVRGLQAVEVTGEALAVTGKGGTRVVRWDTVVTAQHTYYGGDRWAFRTRGGEALQLVLDGYTHEEAARINALIRERLPEGVG
ncbi:MAG TPA: hypothetical protein VGR37_06305 [Longimicrobiaceae bacterium]|nr:hypothetical protein [Longimicrobiaceae bacterium]